MPFGQPRFLRPLKRGGIRAEAFGDGSENALAPLSLPAGRDTARP